MPKRNPMPRDKSEIPSARPRRCGVPINERYWHTRPKDSIPRENFVVTDGFNRLARLKQPLPISPWERRRRIVIGTDECAEMHEYLVTPDIVGEITSTGMTGPTLG